MSHHGSSLPFVSSRSVNISGTIGDDESEIQTIDRDGELQPLLLLFPELNDDQDLVNQIRSKTMSPTTITRALMGKKADFTLLKPAQPLHETVVQF